MFRFKCDGQELRCVMYDEAASGFIDTVFAEFDLCKRWADMVVTVQYTQMQNGVEKTFNESLDSETGIAKVSNSLIDGPVDVSIFGYVPETGARLTTDPVRIRINRSGYKAGGAPSVPPAPDLYAKLLHEVDEIVKKGISDRQIADAVNAHLDANPVQVENIEVVRLVSHELSHTRQEIIDAAESGKTIIGTDKNGVVYVYAGMEKSNIDVKSSVPTFYAPTSSYNSSGNSIRRYIQFEPEGESIITGQQGVNAKNPRPLVFSGAVNATYYGHEQVNITIPKGGEGGGGTEFETDESLILKDGILSVNTADVVEENNTLPVTSAAVYTEVGNINALLATI